MLSTPEIPRIEEAAHDPSAAGRNPVALHCPRVARSVVRGRSPLARRPDQLHRRLGLLPPGQPRGLGACLPQPPPAHRRPALDGQVRTQRASARSHERPPWCRDGLRPAQPERGHRADGGHPGLAPAPRPWLLGRRQCRGGYAERRGLRAPARRLSPRRGRGRQYHADRSPRRGDGHRRGLGNHGPRR